MSQQTPPNLGGKVSRRDFLKLMAAAGTVLTFIPFIDWGKFLPNPTAQVSERAKVELPDGSQANLNSFPVNHAEAVIYPKTDDPTLNSESFRTWQFIRLPEELGEVIMMLHLSECIVWCVCIYGVYGSIGLNPDGKGENAPVMAAYTIH